MGCVADNGQVNSSEKLDIISELPSDSTIVREVSKVADALKKAGVLKVEISISPFKDASVEIDPIGGNRNEVGAILNSLAKNLSDEGFNPSEEPRFLCPYSPWHLRIPGSERSR